MNGLSADFTRVIETDGAVMCGMCIDQQRLVDEIPIDLSCINGQRMKGVLLVMQGGLAHDIHLRGRRGEFRHKLTSELRRYAGTCRAVCHLIMGCILNILVHERVAGRGACRLSDDL